MSSFKYEAEHRSF